MSNAVSGVMNALKAETLLEGSQLFDQIEKLRANVSYTTVDGKLAFDDYFKTLVDAIDAIPKLQLEDDVAPGTETTYTIQLTQEVERIVDECDRIFRRLNQFEGKLHEAERQVLNQKAEFVAWYMLAAATLLKDLEDIKLPQAEIRKLGEAEFSRLMHGLDVALATLLDAVKIETNRASQHKASQKEKYNLGRDQANASWTSSLPAFGNAFTEDRGDVSGVQELDEEDVPAQVKAAPKVSIGDTLRIIKPEDAEIKGTFVKRGDPAPVKVIADSVPVLKDGKPYCDMCHEPGCPWCYPKPETKVAVIPKSPRKRLIEEEDEGL
jgi:hypothetical protein